MIKLGLSVDECEHNFFFDTDLVNQNSLQSVLPHTGHLYILHTTPSLRTQKPIAIGKK